MALGSHNDLLISAPTGGQVADVNTQTVSRSITVGGNTFQVSYGRDANGQLTAILASPNLDSVSLHFSAGGKSIDAEKAVVTLTFSPNFKGVLVDPGYVGTVEVDSHVLRTRSLADDQPIPAALAATTSDVVTPAPAPTTPVAATPTPAPETSVAVTTPAPSSTPLATTAPTPEPATTPGSDIHSATVPLASQIAPMLAPQSSTTPETSAGTYVSIRDQATENETQAKPGQTTREKLFWSEPVTAVDGSAPAVAAEEIRLVEVHGMVTITAPDGAIQTGSEGMLVASGSTVQTSDNSSAALFMGGVNSARLMPNCALIVTQTLVGSVRTDVVNLQAGAVFSRIGHRDGETENYSIATPEGTTAAEANDMMAFRGTPDEAKANSVSTTRIDLGMTPLFAWDPAPSRGLISDVPAWDMGVIDNKKKADTCTYFYYCPSAGPVKCEDIRHEVLSCDDKDKGGDDRGGDNHGGDNHGGDNHDKDNGDHGHNDCHPQQVLQQILETLQPYNTKLKQVLNDINKGTATAAEQAFYQKLTNVFFSVQEPGIVNEFEHDKKKFDKNTDAYNKVLCQDLNEFGLPSLTPH